MTTRWLGWTIAGACALAGCEDGMPQWDGEPVAEGVAAVEGRVDADEGNQHSGAMAAAAAAIAADSVALITVDTVVLAEAAVRDGQFRLDGLAPIEGPFYVESRLDGEVTGRVLVPFGAAGGERTITMPISAETTAEAAAYAALRAAGESVDPIALVTSITAEMAATAETGALATAALAAQIAERAALEAHAGAEMTAEALAEARGRAFARLSAALDAATDAAAEAEAWADYRFEAAVALQGALGAGLEARADAAAAAGVALAEALYGASGFDAAVAFAGEAAGRAQQAVIEARLAASAEARARAEAAFDGFFAAIAEARDAADVQAAHDGLVEALGAIEARGHSMLAALIESEGMLGLVVGEAASSVIEITVDTRIALGAEGDAAQLGEVYADLRGTVQAAVEARMGRLVSSAFVEALTEVVLADAALPSPALITLRQR